MYLFQDTLIDQCIHNVSSGYFHQYRDTNKNLYYSTDELKKLLKKFLNDPNQISLLNRSECLDYLSELLETGCAMADRYDEYVNSRFRDLIYRKKQLWDEFLRADIGLEVRYNTNGNSSYWSERYGLNSKEAITFLANTNAKRLHLRPLLEIKCLSKGPFSTLPITNGDILLSYARAEWFSFQIRCDWYAHREHTSIQVPELASEFSFTKTEEMSKFVTKQLSHLHEAKQWLMDTSNEIHEILSREFSYYPDWIQFIQKK